MHKTPRDPKWPILDGFCFGWDLWLFLDGGEFHVIINEYYFASNAPNSIGFGLNLMIQEEMCQIGKQYSYVLGKLYMKICKDSFYFMFYISTIGIGNWSFESYWGNVM